MPHGPSPTYFLFRGVFGRLEDGDVSVRPDHQCRHDEERDECGEAGVGAHQEVKVLRLRAPQKPRGSTVAETPGR